MTQAVAQNRLDLRAGDLVVVRSREEILATLDTACDTERMPFMPEMLRYCGQTFRVGAVAHKTCDPAHKTGGRRLDNAVHLEGLRCDGAAHGGCQAGCLLFWKTQWLKRAGAAAGVAAPARSDDGADSALQAATQTSTSSSDKRIYRCQATRLYDATELLPWWHPGQYLRDVSCGNVGVGRAAKLLVLSWFRALTRIPVAYGLTWQLYNVAHQVLVGGKPPTQDGGLLPKGAPTPVQHLGLQPGQWVRIRPHEEIRATLTKDNKNRGMWFDDEATVFCNNTYRVEHRVERIVNEVTGEMMQMKTPCITLEGVTCQSMYSRNRLFCPRAIKPYWREIWLEPVAGPDAPGARRSA